MWPGGQPIGLGLLACVGRAALLLDNNGTIPGVNARAEPLLGTDLDVRAGQLVASDRTSNDMLQDLLRTALRRVPLSVSALLPPVVIRRREGRPIVVQALPAPALAAAPDEETGAILVLTDLAAQPELPESRLVLLFGLTPAEARLAVRLVADESVEEAADALHIALGTARNQLKEIFGKTETHRQAELVALLWRVSDMAVDLTT